MLSPEDLKQIAEIVAEQLNPIEKRLDGIDARLDGIDARLDAIEERLDVLEENSEITRMASNELVKWVELNFSHKYPFPVEEVHV